MFRSSGRPFHDEVKNAGTDPATAFHAWRNCVALGVMAGVGNGAPTLEIITIRSFCGCKLPSPVCVNGSVLVVLVPTW